MTSKNQKKNQDWW